SEAGLSGDSFESHPGHGGGRPASHGAGLGSGLQNIFFFRSPAHFYQLGRGGRYPKPGRTSWHLSWESVAPNPQHEDHGGFGVSLVKHQPSPGAPLVSG